MVAIARPGSLAPAPGAQQNGQVGGTDHAIAIVVKTFAALAGAAGSPTAQQHGQIGGVGVTVAIAVRRTGTTLGDAFDGNVSLPQDFTGSVFPEGSEYA